jgi:hypothetical protein
VSILETVIVTDRIKAMSYEDLTRELFQLHLHTWFEIESDKRVVRDRRDNQEKAQPKVLNQRRIFSLV